MGPWDADFRVVMGERNRKLVFASLQDAILNVFHFDNAGNFKDLPDNSCTFDYFCKMVNMLVVKYMRTHRYNYSLDNGSFNLRLNSFIQKNHSVGLTLTSPVIRQEQCYYLIAEATHAVFTEERSGDRCKRYTRS